MINFENINQQIEFTYFGEMGDNNDWIWRKLQSEGVVRLSKVFYFSKDDLLDPPSSDQNFEEYQYSFLFGSVEDDYVRIPARFLNIENDVLISLDITLKRSIFVAERNISIFGRISELLEHKDPIVIGGQRENAIPNEVFEELRKKFPNTYELNRYAEARVDTILSGHLDGMKDARGRYENYLNKKSVFPADTKLDLKELKKLEVEKYILIRDLIADALETKKDWPEYDWQRLMLSFLLLLFPKYIKILEEVKINDYYRDPKKTRNLKIDIALLDANGNIDVIEVKRPFDDKIFMKTLYRNNNIPTRVLSGSIMQSENYLFHLTKWGVSGEEALTKKYGSELPSGMKIRISNPKAIIIVGRDQIGGAEMTDKQLLDFELIKRKYANIMDIITYDDLLRRLNNTIASLGGDPSL